MQDWYVITGGPATGKSTLIELLAAQGRLVVPEAARVVLAEEKQKDSDRLPWRDLSKFQERVAQLQWEFEQAAWGQEAFLDRSFIDAYAYSTYGAVEPPALIEKHARNRYKKVFLLDPLPDYVNDAQRWETQAFRDAIHPLIALAYEHFGYEPVDVPVFPPQERLAFLLANLR